MESVREDSKNAFEKLKPVCVPVLGNSRVTPQSTPKLLASLRELVDVLNDLNQSNIEMQPPLISYVWYPLSSVLNRNEPSIIPDQVLEKVLEALTLLLEHWWWTCDVMVWHQLFILAGAILGGLDGKGKERADETKECTVKLLVSLLRDRSPEISNGTDSASSRKEAAETRLSEIRAHCQTDKFIPILGQTFDSLLNTATSAHLPLQLISLQLITVIVETYLLDSIIPSVLPRVVSVTTRIALGLSINRKAKTWANGDVVVASLHSLQTIIVRAFGDDICIAEGAVREIDNLTDLADLVTESRSEVSHIPTTTVHKYGTARTESWLRGTSSQLMIAINTLTPLVKHSSSPALLALSTFAHRVLLETRLTLPQAQPLLLSLLLPLSNSEYETVRLETRKALLTLLSPSSKGRTILLQTLLQMTTDNLAALPRLLPSQADEKIIHLAGQIEAVCRMGYETVEMVEGRPDTLRSSIHSGIGKVLGSAGHIEKWGWSLLSVLEFSPPSITAARSVVGTHLTIESDLQFADNIFFPEVTLRLVTNKETHAALERMLRALGQAGGELCLPSVEWFIGVGLKGHSSNSVAALWCACKLLEGVADTFLDGPVATTIVQGKGKRLEKFARWLTKAVAELWNKEEEYDKDEHGMSEGSSSHVNETLDADDGRLPIEFVKGLKALDLGFNLDSWSTLKSVPSEEQRVLHRSFSLQLICHGAAILQARFNPLLIYALYPVLHSLVSPSSHLASTALAALQYMTHYIGYATPANLFLANFDYAIDSISRRLTRRWLDLNATKALVILIRLVGKDIVGRAGDVVEECFDRLDDFHGYDAIVGGIIEVLQEVVRMVIEQEDQPQKDPRFEVPVDETTQISDGQRFDRFFDWFEHRNDPPVELDEEEPESGQADDDPNTKHDDPDLSADTPSTRAQDLTKQIVSRSLFFITHGSPAIRAHILTLLTLSVPVLQESALLPSVNRAWPFVLNRLSDYESFVASAAMSFVEALVTHVGGFMTVRVWDDIWPRFRQMLSKLEEADSVSALTKRGRNGVGTESAYTHSHRLYRAMLRTMTAAVRGINIQDAKAWDVALAFRRFLHRQAHPELQECARNLYIAFGENNEGAIWLMLTSTAASHGLSLPHLKQSNWDVVDNVKLILDTLLSN